MLPTLRTSGRTAPRYRALPELVSSITRSAADARSNLGVLRDKQGNRAEAERLYRRKSSRREVGIDPGGKGALRALQRA